MKSRCIFLFLMTTMIWGFAFLVVKDLTNRSTPVFFILCCRFVLGAATLQAIRWLMKSPKITLREFVQSVGVGSVLFVAFATQTWGTALTTPAKNGMLTGTYVVFVPAFLAIFDRRFCLRSIVNAFLCFIGLFFFFEVYRDKSSFDLGSLLSLASGVFFALHFVLIDRFASKIDVMNLSTTQLATVAAWSLAFCFAFDLQKIDVLSLATPRVVWAILFLGIISTGFAYWSQFFAQSKLDAPVVAVVACLESIFAVAFSILFGYEKISLGIVVGTVVVLISTIRAALEPTSPSKSNGTATVESDETIELRINDAR